jgi:Ca2+-binding RTX toxin-like protein
MTATRSLAELLMRRLLPLTLLLALVPVAAVFAKASHAGWPKITGMLLMNSKDQSRPLDGRPGQDLFDGTDPSYSCDGRHRKSACLRSFSRRKVTTVPADIGHNELLGAHGNDSIHAGPAGDVIWGDYKPCCQPTKQVDYLYGGPGKDFIYASHGKNYIYAGGGRDVVHGHFGRGEIHCDSPQVLVYLSHRSRRVYHLFGCKRISYATERSRRH